MAITYAYASGAKMLFDIGETNEVGRPLGRMLIGGRLFPPLPIESILARGYWVLPRESDLDITPEEALARYEAAYDPLADAGPTEPGDTATAEE